MVFDHFRVLKAGIRLLSANTPGLYPQPRCVRMFGVFCNKLDCVTPNGAGSGLEAESGTSGQDSGLSF